jgi:hypothetical protein
MEETHQGKGEDHLPMSKAAAAAEAASLEFIRTETVLSRLPVHNLAKQGRVNIQIVKTTPTGEVELKWEVSYSDRYGQARQLAYKLDTIIINQRIEEAGRPLPKLLRIGSLNDICAELNLATHAGQNSKDLKRAFLQNASAFITAKFDYRANDGTERHVEAGVTRYGVIFTGEKLPDGRKADAVYITFNDPFWDVLNNAPVRPLDRAYMKQLPPAAQRFYEIISRKIFAALKNDYARAKITYSEYCTFSAQLRHFERQRVQDQMAKVIRHHKKFGHITAVKYEPTIDGQNQPDWTMYLTPGPKALAEFAAANSKRRLPKMIVVDSIEKRDRDQQVRQSRPQALQPKRDPPVAPPTFDPQLVAEFTRRGIDEKRASELLANLKPGQDVVAQLEQADQMIQHAGFPIRNPAGFTIRLIERNIPVPDGFETTAKRKAREEQESTEYERRVVEDAHQALEWEYEAYREAEVDRYIAANPASFEALKNAKWDEDRKRYSFTTESMAKLGARFEIQKQLPLLTFEEFQIRKQPSPDFSMKPVAVSADAELAPAPDEVVMTDDAVIPQDGRELTAESGDEMQPEPEPNPQPAMPDAAVEHLPDSVQPEPDGNGIGPGVESNGVA